MKQPLSIAKVKARNSQRMTGYIVMGGLIVSLIVSCSASEEQQVDVISTQAEETDVNLSQRDYCDSWGYYATVMLKTYEVAKREGMNPLDTVKSWSSYDNTEEGSPGRIYFDAVLRSVKSQPTPQMVREVGEQVCAKFTEDQMDSANFYDAIE
ncbi:MAG: hypothetical protein COB36_12705 [Alphaproteobacteria bacterium]|nr:MAG: hypothetical protein COB36_12705 [Alphaproteobacteria bacterium]